MAISNTVQVMHLDVQPNHRVVDVLELLCHHYGIPTLRLPDDEDNHAILTKLVHDGTVYEVIDPIGKKYEIKFSQNGTGVYGVQYNIALSAAKQLNAAYGPGSSVARNTAQGKKTEQTNTSMCTIL